MSVNERNQRSQSVGKGTWSAISRERPRSADTLMHMNLRTPEQTVVFAGGLRISRSPAVKVDNVGLQPGVSSRAPTALPVCSPAVHLLLLIFKCPRVFRHPKSEISDYRGFITEETPFN
ncbi:hypothetical protein MPTK1_4g13830 [Marchantia polymorpha subsp. ruderalis]|uniref:Uncharacterized protein n=2 Tax=Marchantia polymorpha TaxID=3197 RepID=A0AAF6B9M9_MARPO|nr:hypothetical protein MARPO_0070s0098 [Marchantia polymorpha]BBN08713.1 hypothetical protein Mp_4g13830 [Marchantia polymorpha subsp. ruderalis]|eukprot:PTQ35641.1 hypothetical protein MARPO_0070s0098 [Marchantia polymorpha]